MPLPALLRRLGSQRFELRLQVVPGLLTPAWPSAASRSPPSTHSLKLGWTNINPVDEMWSAASRLPYRALVACRNSCFFNALSVACALPRFEASAALKALIERSWAWVPVVLADP